MATPFDVVAFNCSIVFTFKTPLNRSFPEWLLIFLLLTPLTLNSCSSDSKTNLPKYTTLHLTPPTLLETLASSLTNILLSLTKLHLSPKSATITFVNCLYYLYLYRSLEVWLATRCGKIYKILFRKFTWRHRLTLLRSIVVKYVRRKIGVIDYSSISGKNFVNFGPVTCEILWRVCRVSGCT